jgi:hypothetical protein
MCFLVLFSLFFASCAARISGSLQANGQAALNIYAALEPRMTALIARLANAGSPVPGGQQSVPILNGPAISASMSAAPGVASVSFKNTAPSAIEGPVKVSRIGDFLAGGKTGGFISFEQSPPGAPSGGGRCVISINLDSGPKILALISPDIGDYLAAIMAPLATGEVLTKAKYLEEVSLVWGKGIADEIANASIRASIDFPGQVQSVKGGTFSGRKAEFNIPLLDLLVLETPLSYEVTWR